MPFHKNTSTRGEFRPRPADIHRATEIYRKTGGDPMAIEHLKHEQSLQQEIRRNQQHDQHEGRLNFMAEKLKEAGIG